MVVPEPEPIALTPGEDALVRRIPFDSRSLSEETAETAAAAVTLTHSLLERDAVPPIRLRYVTDPALNVGGHGKSRVEVFEQNGARGDDMLAHFHFRRYLRYFIYGPDLPAATVTKFRQVLIDDMGTSGEILDQLKAVARAQARALSRHGRTDLHEEFFKLALECDVDEYVARCIRDAVRQVK